MTEKEYTCINCPRNIRCVLTVKGDIDDLPEPGFCPFGICGQPGVDNSNMERTR